MVASGGGTGAGRVGIGILLVLGTALISGVSNFLNFGAVRGTSVDAFLTIRNGIVALLLVPPALLLSRARARGLAPRDWVRLVLIGLVGGSIPFLLFFRGLQMAASAPAANATFPFRTLFLMAMVLGVVFLKERLSPRLAVAMGILLAGNALLLTFTGPMWTDGTPLVIAATALWAGEYALSKHTLRGLPAGTVALGRMGFGALFLSVYLVVSGEIGAVGAFRITDWQNLVLSALLLTGFVTTWYAGLKQVDLTVATATLALATPITTGLSFVVVGNGYSMAYAAGVVAIALGAVVVIGLASLRESWTFLSGSLGTLLGGARRS